MNVVILMGRLTKDPEIRATQSGDQVASFTLAVPKGKDATNFFRCTAFGRTAEFLEKYGRKGTKFITEGQLDINKWEKDGQKHEVPCIIVNRCEFAESKNSQPEPKPEPKKDELVDVPADLDDELPFN